MAVFTLKVANYGSTMHDTLTVTLSVAPSVNEAVLIAGYYYVITNVVVNETDTFLATGFNFNPLPPP